MKSKPRKLAYRLSVTNLESGIWRQKIRLRVRRSCQYFKGVDGVVVRLAEPNQPWRPKN
jgi:hypothetical protein